MRAARERLEKLFISCHSSSLHFPLLSQMSHSPSLGVSIRWVGQVILLPTTPLSAFHVLTPHSCSLCVTSSHCLFFSNQLSLSIKPPHPPPFFPSAGEAQNQMSKSVGELNPNVSRVLYQIHESRAAMTCWSQLKGKVSSPLMCTITDVPSYLQAVWYWLFDGTSEQIPAHLCHVGGKMWQVQVSQQDLLQ